MFDKRLMGYCIYAGSNISNITNYLYKPLEFEQREKTLRMNVASNLESREKDLNVNVVNNLIIKNFSFSRNYMDPSQCPYQYLEWWTIFYASVNVYFLYMRGDQNNFNCGIYFELFEKNRNVLK